LQPVEYFIDLSFRIQRSEIQPDSVSGKPKRAAYHEVGSPLIHAEINMRSHGAVLAQEFKQSHALERRSVAAQLADQSLTRANPPALMSMGATVE
jgi:hypothetical protein